MKTSRPYRTGGTPVWTTTSFDALGRPSTVTLPDGKSSTYSYSAQNDANWKGTLTLITDPAGKRKQYLHDALGRLARVDEPDSSNTLIETARYTYDVMGRLTTVEMGKRTDNTFKQTRTFVYNTKGQFTSATNPESGTVTYTYNADGLLESKTDAKGQTLWYFYDTYHRLNWTESPRGTWKTSSGYDATSGYSSNGVGRLTSAYNDGYTWHFGYDLMGRVTKQTLEALPSGMGTVFFQAQYSYDAEGRLTYLYYPGAGNSLKCAVFLEVAQALG